MSLTAARPHSLSANCSHRSASGRLMAVLAALWLSELLFTVYVVARAWPDIVFSLDFASFWSGAVLVRGKVGHSLYDLGVQEAFQQAVRHEQAVGTQMRDVSGAMPYWNPPPLLLPFLPVSLLPITWGYVAWLGVSLLTFVASVSLPLRGAIRGRAKAVALLAYMGVAGTLLEGQVNSVLLLCFALGLLALRAERGFLGGLLIGALWLKPQYAVLFPLVFIVKRRWREVGGMAFAGLLVALVSLAMIGPDGLAQYLSTLAQVGGYRAAPASFASPESMANWRALLLKLLPGLTEESGVIVMWGLGAATGLSSLLVWRGPWEARSPRFPLQMLVATAATLIATPHSHLHGTVLLLAPLSLALARADDLSVSPAVWHLVLAAGYSLALVAWVFRGLSWLFVPYLLVAALLLGRRAAATGITR